MLSKTKYSFSHRKRHKSYKNQQNRQTATGILAQDSKPKPKLELCFDPFL